MNIKEQLQQKIDTRTKPQGSLGILEEIALQIGQIQNTLSPQLQKPTMLVFAADHGLTAEGISPYPKDVTWQMVMNFCSGGAAINVFCKQNGIELKVFDVGVDFDFGEELPIVQAKIARGSRNMRNEPAMTKTECEKAIQQGRDFVKAEVSNGCNTIAFGEMGIGNTSASALIMHKITGFSIEDCTGKGAGLTNAAVDNKTIILKEIADKYVTNSPKEILATFGGLEIASMVGGFLEAKNQKMVILVDGFIATAAVLTAIQMDASVIDNCIFCHSSEEKGHKKMLSFLGVRSLLSLCMRLGEGTGAAVAFPIVKSALAFLNEMASFENAGVSGIE